jgi:hypothetical protein
VPRLRDASTGESVAEGAADDLVLIAAQLGQDEVVFDDVGPHFDRTACMNQVADAVAALTGDALATEITRREALLTDPGPAGRLAAARDRIS